MSSFIEKNKHHKNPKKKINFFVISLNLESGGGSHFNALNYINFLKKSGFEVVLHTLRKGVNSVPTDIVVVEHDIGSNSFKNSNAAIKSLLFNCESDSDLFFMYGVDMIWAAGQYRKEKGQVPVAVYLDNYLNSMKLSQWMGYSYYLRRLIWDKCIGLKFAQYVDAYFAVSPFVQETYCTFGFPEKKFCILPNFFTFKNDFLAEKKEVSPVQILYAGRLIRDKGVDLLLNAVSKIPEDISWALKIIGSGPLAVSCKEFVTVKGLDSKVTFLPWLSQADLTEEYRGADIFVHPARWPEPFGRTVIEAMENNLAVIVPRKGGSSWIVEDSGLTFANGDEHSLYAALQTLIVDKKLREDLSVKATKRLSFFSETTVGPHFVEYVNDLITISR